VSNVKRNAKKISDFSNYTKKSNNFFNPNNNSGTNLKKENRSLSKNSNSERNNNNANLKNKIIAAYANSNKNRYTNETLKKMSSLCYVPMNSNNPISKGSFVNINNNSHRQIGKNTNSSREIASFVINNPLSNNQAMKNSNNIKIIDYEKEKVKDATKKQIMSSKIKRLVGDEDSVILDE
jgi:hypothetical protein